jgi:hypothetical protein
MLFLGKPAAVVAAGLVILAVGPASASIAAPRAAQPSRPAQAPRPAQRRQANGTWRLSQGSSGPVLQAASAGTHVRLAPRTSPGQHRNWLRRSPR